MIILEYLFSTTITRRSANIYNRCFFTNVKKRAVCVQKFTVAEAFYNKFFKANNAII